MSEDMPEDMPDHMPEDMPDRMPNRMSEDMSDRMPEDLPVRKCINVMVGITRSKVIFNLCVLACKSTTGIFCNYIGYIAMISYGSMPFTVLPFLGDEHPKIKICLF